MKRSLNLSQYAPPTKVDMCSWQDEMRASFFEAVTPDDMREIVAKLVEDAKKGDKAATKILLSYGIGSAQINVKNAVIVQDRKPLPAPPSKALPGTNGRVEDMARRAANGRELFDARDKKFGEA